MVKREIVETLAKRTGITNSMSTVIVDEVFKIMNNELSNGGEVVVRGFGRFYCKKRKASIARNITKGVPIELPETNMVRFKPCRELKEAVANVK